MLTSVDRYGPVLYCVILGVPLVGHNIIAIAPLCKTIALALQQGERVVKDLDPTSEVLWLSKDSSQPVPTQWLANR